MKELYRKMEGKMEWYLLGFGIIQGFFLCVSPNLNYDESYSFAMTKLSVHDLISITALDVHPPLYYLALKFFLKLTVLNTVQMAKCYSLVCYIAYLLVIIGMGTSRFGKRVSRFWLFLSIMIPCMVVQSTCVRMYMFGIFWTTLVGFLLFDYYQTTNNWKRNILVIVSSLIAMYAHTFTMVGIFLMYVVMTVALLIYKEWKKLKVFICCGLLVGIGYLPWLNTLIWQAENRRDIVQEHSLRDLLVMLMKEWFSSEQRSVPLSYKMGFILFAILISICIWRSIREKKYRYVIAVVPFILLVCVGVMLSFFVKPCFFGRHALCVIPGLFLAAAYGYEKIPRCCKVLTVIAIMMMYGITYIGEIQFERDDGLDKWEQLCEQYIDEDDLLLIPAIHGAIFEAPCDEMFFGRMPDFSPFVDIEDYTVQSQLEPYEEQDVWWLTVNQYTPEWYGLKAEKKDEFTYQNIYFSLHRLTSP